MSGGGGVGGSGRGAAAETTTRMCHVPRRAEPSNGGLCLGILLGEQRLQPRGGQRAVAEGHHLEVLQAPALEHAQHLRPVRAAQRSDAFRAAVPILSEQNKSSKIN